MHIDFLGIIGTCIPVYFFLDLSIFVVDGIGIVAGVIFYNFIFGRVCLLLLCRFAHFNYQTRQSVTLTINIYKYLNKDI